MPEFPIPERPSTGTVPVGVESCDPESPDPHLPGSRSREAQSSHGVPSPGVPQPCSVSEEGSGSSELSTSVPPRPPVGSWGPGTVRPLPVHPARTGFVQGLLSGSVRTSRGDEARPANAARRIAPTYWRERWGAFATAGAMPLAIGLGLLGADVSGASGGLTPTVAEPQHPSSESGAGLGFFSPSDEAVSRCVRAGWAAGFPVGKPLVTAVAVALAESRCNPTARGTNTVSVRCPEGSIDRGLWQINSCYHEEVNDHCAYQVQCNADAAFVISHRGLYWKPWSTFKNGQYQRYVTMATNAVAELCPQGQCSTGHVGLVVAGRYVNVRTGPGRRYELVTRSSTGHRVRLLCWTSGQYVGEGRWPSHLWDRIVDDVTGKTGYATDSWIRTPGEVQRILPRC